MNRKCDPESSSVRVEVVRLSLALAAAAAWGALLLVLGAAIAEHSVPVEIPASSAHHARERR